MAVFVGISAATELVTAGALVCANRIGCKANNVTATARMNLSAGDFMGWKMAIAFGGVNACFARKIHKAAHQSHASPGGLDGGKL